MVTKQGAATVAQLAEFDEVIDARSPSEYTDDHLPNARNFPVLDDEQRAEIGTLYKQVSPFAAKRRGAALVARNVAEHILNQFQDRPKNWRPLVYCWRGGQRSGAFTTILRQIGWDAHQLEGGYKAWRRHVVAELKSLPNRFEFRIVCGATGSGKTGLLTALAAQGAQVLDLEGLAAHKGSILGGLPDEHQPSQCLFDSRLYQTLHQFDPSLPVYAEAESRRIGRLEVPTGLIEKMRQSPCLTLEASLPARVAYLLQDYAYFLNNPALLLPKLDAMKELRGGDTVARWKEMAQSGHWAPLVEELLASHYDPLYCRSQDRNYGQYLTGQQYTLDDLGPTSLAAVAGQILTGKS